MTQYVYYDEMQSLCLRLGNAFKVTRPEDKPLIDLYDSAEEGFFRKKENLLINDAGVPISDKQKQRVESFRAYVVKEEVKAAYKLKEENDARKSKRTAQ